MSCQISNTFDTFRDILNLKRQTRKYYMNLELPLCSVARKADGIFQISGKLQNSEHHQSSLVFFRINCQSVCLSLCVYQQQKNVETYGQPEGQTK